MIIEGNTTTLDENETDALLEFVSKQLDTDKFNPDDRQTLQQMVQSLGDKRGLIRLSFAEALGDIGTPATPFLLDAIANHPNVVVRRASAKTLTLIADPQAVPVLVETLLKDEDTVVKGSCVGALARVGEASVPALLEILASSAYSETEKGLVTWALAFIGVEAQEYVYKQVNSQVPEVRAAVIGSIAAITQQTDKYQGTEERALQVLISGLDDPVSFVRCEATTALSNLKYRPAVGKLIDLFKTHPDWETRKAAALALMKIGDGAAIEPLQAALESETEAAVVAVIKLAMNQLERIAIEDDW